MNYSRGLQFTADPDYKYIIGLFQGAMERNSIDVKIPDFMWNRNRLLIEKQLLKDNMKKAIMKSTKKKDGVGETTKE